MLRNRPCTGPGYTFYLDLAGGASALCFIVAKIVDGSKVFAAVKAREAFGECTSMSCLEARVCGAVRLRRRLAGVEVSSADGTEMGLPAGLSSPLERQSVLGFR